jgi:hypothetical protein
MAIFGSPSDIAMTGYRPQHHPHPHQGHDEHQHQEAHDVTMLDVHTPTTVTVLAYDAGWPSRSLSQMTPGKEMAAMTMVGGSLSPDTMPLEKVVAVDRWAARAGYHALQESCGGSPSGGGDVVGAVMW